MVCDDANQTDATGLTSRVAERFFAHGAVPLNLTGYQISLTSQPRNKHLIPSAPSGRNQDILRFARITSTGVEAFLQQHLDRRTTAFDHCGEHRIGSIHAFEIHVRAMTDQVGNDVRMATTGSKMP